MIHTTQQHRIWNSRQWWPIVILALTAFLTATASADHRPGHNPGGGGGPGGGGAPPPPPPGADPATAFRTGSGALAVMNADGSNLTTIANGLYSVPFIQWSPDLDGDPSNGYQGTIAFHRYPGNSEGLDIWLCDVRVVDGVPQALRLRKVVAGEVLWGFSLSPDLDPDTPGYQGILIYTSVEEDSYDIIRGISVDWDANAADPSTVETPLDEPIFVGADHGLFLIDSPHWSADGSRIIFCEWSAMPEAMRLYILDDLNAPEPRVLLSSNEVGPDGSIVSSAWSRWSETIAIRAHGGWLWMLDPDDPASLTPVGIQGSTPSWAPGDTSLVFSAVASPGNTQKILRYDFATGSVTTLAGDKKVHYQFPHWRPF
jgi:hypothetical protein